MPSPRSTLDESRAPTHHPIMRRVRPALLALCLLASVTPTDTRGDAIATEPKGHAFSLSSPAFAHEKEIPSRFTCEGQDISPELRWSAPPTGTRSLALIVDDPDAPDPAAPKRTWVHWVLIDIPAGATGSPEGTPPGGARVGKNDWNKTAWGGPCPPIGRHRYYFKLYALDRTFPDLRHPTKVELEAAMKGHILAHATLMGTYQKRKK
jgi:Raf kinase inhibitor-like YbhB/YbcL family protein